MKIVEEKLLKIYKEVYAECKVDFDKLKEKDRNNWFTHYFVPQEKQEEIVKKHLRWVRNEYIRKAITVNYCLGCSPMGVDFYYKLTRTDGLIKQSSRVKWIEFDENGKFKESFTLPLVGRSLLMSPFNAEFVWQTTEVTEILEENRDFVRFTTKNSEYKLERIIKNE